jgi:Domain of unknown function (DUF1963)
LTGLDLPACRRDVLISRCWLGVLAGHDPVSFPQFEHPDLHAVFKDPGADLHAFLNHPVNNDVFLEALRARHTGPCHQVGGYAAPVQGPVEYEIAAAALGGGIRGDDPHVRAEQARWILLAQIDSDHRAGMIWGDCGAFTGSPGGKT